MKMIFVAGTDTDAGKTIVTGLLGRYLAKEGYNVVTQKWVQTGNGRFAGDIAAHLKLMGKTKNEFSRSISLMAPYAFKYASSPHLAARLEGKNVRINKIKNTFRKLAKDFDIVIAEGIGGLLVPLNNRRLLIDVVKRFRLPVLLVAKNRIGAINHTLLSIEALRSRDMRIMGVIFNNVSKNSPSLALENNVRIVKSLTDVAILGQMPHVRDLGSLHKHFTPIGKRITALL